MVWWPGREEIPLIQGHWVQHNTLTFVGACINSILLVHPNLVLGLLNLKSSGT